MQKHMPKWLTKLYNQVHNITTSKNIKQGIKTLILTLYGEKQYQNGGKKI